MGSRMMMARKHAHQAIPDHDSSDEQDCSGDMSHADECARGEFSVALSDQKAKQNEPQQASDKCSQNTHGFAREGVIDPVMRNKCRGDRDPEKKDGGVSENAHETNPESGMRM